MQPQGRAVRERSETDRALNRVKRVKNTATTHTPVTLSLWQANTSTNEESTKGNTSHTQKHFGVVYTPEPVVNMMLDKLPSLKDVAICDPSCGNGQFLVAIAEKVCRKIRSCRSEKTRKAYYATLNKLTGSDIDKNVLEQCRTRLNEVALRYECGSIHWNLRQADAIDRTAWKNLKHFDYVIGNPPYVRIQHLEAHRRARINIGEWRLMAGCSDLFILFFELGLALVKSGGKLIYITPNTWMKSKSGEMLRNHLQKNHTICSITDFGEHQVFANATTYTAITEISKGDKPKQPTTARKCTGFIRGKPAFIDGKLFCDPDGWKVLSVREYGFIRSIKANKIKLADVADIHVGIQTLADDIFIHNEGVTNIEPEITKRVIKASVMKEGRDIVKRVVIYPYKNGKLIPEDELAGTYPKAYAYLRRCKKRLLARDKGKTNPHKWYGFGREVSIVSGFGEKILTSGMNPSPNFQCCPDPDALFYSGYCIKPHSGVSLSKLLKELNSNNMAEYIRLTSRPYKNGWFSYAKSFIQSFPLPDNIYAAP